MRGVAYQSYQEGTYADATQDVVLDQLVATGANWLSLNTPFIFDPESGVIGERRGVTDFYGLPTALARARQRKLHTALYLFVQLPSYGSLWDASQHRPRDTGQFFRYLSHLASAYADLAEREGVELLIIGNEMNAISGPEFREQWLEIVRIVRSRYRGKITYNTIPSFFERNVTTTEIEKHISFWQELDYIGFSMWPSLTDTEVPTPEEAERGWTANRYAQANILQNLKAWSRLTNKPVVFVEIGYPSRNGAATNPGTPNGNRQNNELQAMLYDVMFRQISRESGDWLAGMFLWAADTWNTSNSPGYYTGGYRDGDFAFVGKPAYDVIKAWFSSQGERRLWPARRQ